MSWFQPQRKNVLSAIQPSNQPHLGNYLGAIKNWVQYQDQYNCIFFAVDLHSITTPQDPKQLLENTYLALATYLACGIDPKKSLLFVQSQVPQHAELTWILTCFTGMGELSRMTQFKDKTSKMSGFIPAGLFSYPILMAADILLYNTHLVPVGEDQKQHLELTRDLAQRVNHHYQSELFVVPEPMIAKVGARIMSLQNPDSKMSKSSQDIAGCIYLNDSDKEIEKKFKRAVTDSGSEVKAEEQSSGIKNLVSIQSTLLNEDYNAVLNRYIGKGYGYLKVDTGNLVIEKLRPIREKVAEFMNDRKSLDTILQAGSEEARQAAQKKLNEVYKQIGFIRR